MLTSGFRILRGDRYIDIGGGVLGVFGGGSHGSWEDAI